MLTTTREAENLPISSPMVEALPLYREHLNEELFSNLADFQSRYQRS